MFLDKQEKEELLTLRRQLKEQQATIAGLLADLNNAHVLIRDSDGDFGTAQIALDTMRKQRDHARRCYCTAQAATIQGMTPQKFAENLEWDCFKEEG